MKKVFTIVPVLMLVLGLAVFSIGAVGAQDAPTFRIVSHGGAGNPFWIVVIKGMEDACALLNADCAWLAHPVDSVDDMAGYWDDALAANPDGIGTTVPNPEVIRDAVGRANEAGIPVIVLNTADPNSGTADALDTLFYIGRERVHRRRQQRQSCAGRCGCGWRGDRARCLPDSGSGTQWP